jgi:hypothetical protein
LTALEIARPELTNARSRRLVILVLAAAMAVVGLAAAPAQAAYSVTSTPTWSPRGTVFAITVHGDRIYIAGSFTKLKNIATGQYVTRNRVAALDASSGNLISSFNPNVDGTVRAVEVSADGSRVFLGGDFTSVNGTPRSKVAAVDTGGSLISSWDPSATGAVRDLVAVGSDLFLAGTFGKVDGKARGGLARVDVTTGSVSSWKVVAQGGKPRAIFPAPNGTDLIIAGSFATLAGQPRPFLGSATLSSGDVTGWAPPAACDTCDIFDVVASGNDVYGAVGGGGGRAVSWSAATGGIQWTVRSDGNAQAVAVIGGTLYVGGHFGPTFASQPRSQLAAVNAGNGQVLPWAPDLGTDYFPGVWALVATPDYLLVGGGFRSVAGQPQARYAELPYI